MLRTSFGLSLASTNANQFLLKKIQHKLKYQSSTKISLVGRKIVVNNILLFNLWYFISVWEGTKKRITKVTRLFKNYLWASTNQNNRCQVAWDQCCEKNAVLVQWIMHAFEPSDSNLKSLLRYYFKNFQPYKGSKQLPNLKWLVTTPVK